MGRTTSPKLVEAYLDYCRRERGRTPQTVYKYGLSLTTLLAHLGPIHVLDASTADLRDWVHAPKVKNGAGLEPAPATVKRKVAELRSFYRWLHEIEGLMPLNPARRLAAPTVHNENPHPVRDDVWQALWRSTLTDSDRVAFGLAFFCGLRRAEVTALTPANLADVPRPMIAGFRRKGGKTGNVPWLSCVQLFEQRRPDLIGDSATMIEPMLRLRRDRAERTLLLDWRDGLSALHSRPKYAVPSDVVDPYHFNRHLRRALSAVGLDDAATPHQLRHGFATNALNMGVPLLAVSRLMGHSTVTVTQRYIATSDDPLAVMLEDEVPVLAGPWG
jgi:site-specific recombinase XerD